MGIREHVRATARKVLGVQTTKRLGRYFRKTLPDARSYCDLLRGRQGLEIGGPSNGFSDEGFLPVYQYLNGLDNCLYASDTIWAGRVAEGGTFAFHPSKAMGNQIVCEASDLAPIANESYDCVLACHCLEHLANPLRALNDWKRVLRPNGLLLLILPHREGTFDWRRPVTTLEHLIADRINDTQETDLTHLPEILELHDLTRDSLAGSKEQFRERCLNNFTKRAMHHHVFNTTSAIRMLDHCGLKILRTSNMKPYHIVLLAERIGIQPDNSIFLDASAAYRLTSPFVGDTSL
jgi:SAM-dependent methyltransferase